MEAHQQKTRMEMNWPAWLADGLRQLSLSRKESVNQLVLSAVLKEYPELKELQQHTFLRRLLSRSGPRSEPVADPGQTVT